MPSINFLLHRSAASEGWQHLTHLQEFRRRRYYFIISVPVTCTEGWEGWCINLIPPSLVVNPVYKSSPDCASVSPKGERGEGWGIKIDTSPPVISRECEFLFLSANHYKSYAQWRHYYYQMILSSTYSTKIHPTRVNSYRRVKCRQRRVYNSFQTRIKFHIQLPPSAELL